MAFALATLQGVLVGTIWLYDYKSRNLIFTDFQGLVICHSFCIISLGFYVSIMSMARQADVLDFTKIKILFFMISCPLKKLFDDYSFVIIL